MKLTRLKLNKFNFPKIKNLFHEYKKHKPQIMRNYFLETSYLIKDKHRTSNRIPEPQ